MESRRHQEERKLFEIGERRGCSSCGCSLLLRTRHDRRNANLLICARRQGIRDTVPAYKSACSLVAQQHQNGPKLSDLPAHTGRTSVIRLVVGASSHEAQEECTSETIFISSLQVSISSTVPSPVNTLPLNLQQLQPCLHPRLISSRSGFVAAYSTSLVPTTGTGRVFLYCLNFT